MTMLMDNQGRLKRLYDAAAKEHQEANLKSQLMHFIESIVKQTDVMRRTRMQSVVEMTLEPISELDLSDLLARLAATENEKASSLKKIVDFERGLSELYARCSPRVAQMSADATQLLTELSLECTERARGLSETAGEK